MIPANKYRSNYYFSIDRNRLMFVFNSEFLDLLLKFLVELFLFIEVRVNCDSSDLFAKLKFLDGIFDLFIDIKVFLIMFMIKFCRFSASSSCSGLDGFLKYE